jgi:NAD(P)-dependent dehydrogenase (short-subunit alcohol dehydrogenase family)
MARSETPVMLVTGGGRGIGAAVAHLASQSGYRVCVNYRTDADSASAVVEAIVKGGGDATAFAADVGSAGAVTELFDHAESSLGPVTALVNNAAIVGRQAGIGDIDDERIERILKTNVTGVFNCSREAIRRMSAAGTRGSIVNISSVAARTGSPFEYLDYAASKGAVDAMSAGLAREAAPLGIRVNLVRPGFIHTDMHASGGEPGRVDRLAPGIPMQRGGTPDEVARAVLWFCSNEASYAVGTRIDVTGGV